MFAWPIMELLSTNPVQDGEDESSLAWFSTFDAHPAGVEWGYCRGVFFGPDTSNCPVNGRTVVPTLQQEGKR